MKNQGQSIIQAINFQHRKQTGWFDNLYTNSQLQITHSNYNNMHEYITPQQNININISYNMDAPKMSKSFFGKKVHKNSKIVPEKNQFDLHVNMAKKAEELNSKLEENRQSIQGKNLKSKKKNLKCLPNSDVGFEKRVKTEGNINGDPLSITCKKEPKNNSKIFKKSLSNHFKSLNHQSTQLTSKLTTKKVGTNQSKSKPKPKKSHNKSCMISFQKKSPIFADVQHIISTVGPSALTEEKIQKKRANSTTMIKNDKVVNKLLNMSMIHSEIGGSIALGSENRQINLPSSAKNLKFLLNSIDVRLIKQMQTDQKQASPIKKRPGDGIQLITYLNKIKRIPMTVLNQNAIKIQRAWRSKVCKSVFSYYRGLFKHAASGLKEQSQEISLISEIQSKKREEKEEGEDTYSNIELVEKFEKEEEEKQEIKNKWFMEEDLERESLSLNIKKYRQIVDKELKKSTQQEASFEKITEKSKETDKSKEKQTQQWNNINKLLTLKMNERGGVINSKELLDQLMKQSLLHKQWIEDDEINVQSQKQSQKNSEKKIQINQDVHQKWEDEPSIEENEDYNWGKYSGVEEKCEKQEQATENNKWICDQILMENGVVQNYLDCGLSNFGLHLEEAVHHNSRQQNNEEQIFSNAQESEGRNSDEKIYIFPNEDSEVESKRNQIEEQINTKRKQKLMDHVLKKLVEEFATDVSSILKKTQNSTFMSTVEPSPPAVCSGGITTNFQYIRDYIKQLKSFIIENQGYTKKVTEHLKINVGPTSKEILTYLRVENFDDDKFEDESNEDVEEDGIFVIPNDLFETFHRFFTTKEEEKKKKPFNKKVKAYLQFWHRSMFQCFNQCLDYERPFGITGAPYIWITQSKLAKKIQLKKIPQIFDNAENRLLELTYSPSGIIFEKCDSQYKDAGLSEECKYQLNEQRISRMLATQIIDDEYNWITYNDEMTELMVEISSMVEDVLLFQISSDLKKINRRRKIYKLEDDDPLIQHAVFQIQQL